MTKSRLPIALALVIAPFMGSCGDRQENSPMTKEIRTLEISYDAGDTLLRGYLAMPEGIDGGVPGVLVIHEWWGHNDFVRGRAEQLAELGYAAFALDMYGEGKQADHPDSAGAFMSEVMDNADVMKERFRAALDILHAQGGVDGERTAVIGYCMGGGIALAMARQGADLDAVVSFHGSIGAGAPAAEGAVKAKLLICTGADDPFVPAEQVESVREEMESVGADCEIVAYPGVVHAFTNPGATAKGEEFGLPLKYDSAADADSWSRMKALFAATF